MKKLNGIVLIASVVLFLFSCDLFDDTTDPVESGLLDNFIRIEARLTIDNCTMLQTHPNVPDRTAVDLINVYFDSRDGTVSIDENANEIFVDFNNTGFLGEEHKGELKATLMQTDQTFRIDLQAQKTDSTSVVSEYYSFAVKDALSTSDEVITDVSTLRYLDFEFTGNEVCMALQNVTNPYRQNNNPAYYWHSTNAFSNDLQSISCDPNSRLMIRIVFDAS